MKTPRICLLLLLATAYPAAAQKVFIDYDNATAFSQYRTYQFKETREAFFMRALRAQTPRDLQQEEHCAVLL